MLPIRITFAGCSTRSVMCRAVVLLVTGRPRPLRGGHRHAVWTDDHHAGLVLAHMLPRAVALRVLVGHADHSTQPAADLPTWSPASIIRCASAACSSGRVRVDGAHRSCPRSSGHTCSTTAAQIAAFSLDRPGPQRGRDHRAALAQQLPEVQLALGAALQADHHQPPLGGQRIHVAGQVGRPMLSRITSAPWPSVAVVTSSTKSSLVVVDRPRRRPATRHSVQLLGAPAVATTRAPSAAASWIAIVPMPPAAAVHEQRLAGLQPGDHEHVRPHRAGHLRQRRRRSPGRCPSGHRHHLAGGYHHLLGVPAAGQQRAHPSPTGQPVTPAPTALTVPEHSRPSTSEAPGGGG